MLLTLLNHWPATTILPGSQAHHYHFIKGPPTSSKLIKYKLQTNPTSHHGYQPLSFIHHKTTIITPSQSLSQVPSATSILSTFQHLKLSITTHQQHCPTTQFQPPDTNCLQSLTKLLCFHNHLQYKPPLTPLPVNLHSPLVSDALT